MFHWFSQMGLAYLSIAWINPWFQPLCRINRASLDDTYTSLTCTFNRWSTLHHSTSYRGLNITLLLRPVCTWVAIFAFFYLENKIMRLSLTITWPGSWIIREFPHGYTGSAVVDRRSSTILKFVFYISLFLVFPKSFLFIIDNWHNVTKHTLITDRKGIVMWDGKQLILE